MAFCLIDDSLRISPCITGWSREGEGEHRSVSTPIIIFQSSSRIYCDRAFNHYLTIDPYEPETRNKATQFKQAFCWQSVRIHFVGVWCANFLHHALTP